MGGIASGDVEIASGHGAGDDERAGFDAVGNDAVLRAFQLGYAFHADGGRACAFDLRSHLVQQVGEVGDFGLAGAVLQDGFAFGEGRGHEQVFGAGDGDLVENNFRALEAGGAGFDVAVFLRDLRAELFEAFDVEIDGAAADGAAAGERDAGVSAAGDQRAEDQRGGAHGLDQFVGGFGGGEGGAVDGGAVLGASVAEFDFGAHGGEQVARGLDVADLRNVFEDDGLVGEQGGGHAGERGVFRAADADGAEQRLSAADYELVHGCILAGVVEFGRLIGRALDLGAIHHRGHGGHRGKAHQPSEGRRGHGGESSLGLCLRRWLGGRGLLISSGRRRLGSGLRLAASITTATGVRFAAGFQRCGWRCRDRLRWLVRRCGWRAGSAFRSSSRR